MASFSDNTAIARVDWWQPLGPSGASETNRLIGGATRAMTLEDWVWQTLDGIAGAAGVKALDDEESEEPTSQECAEHLVSMVSSITFSAS